MVLETPNHEELNVNTTKKVVDSEQHTSEENVAKLNDNHQLAKEKADEIVKGLPDTLDQLSQEQQKKFIELVEPLLQNIDGFADLIPNKVPKTWQEKLDEYLKVESNISNLPPEKQEQFKNAKKEALKGATEETKKILA